ncbi:MAG TPA: hypothetical protein VGN54_02675 [Mycobacteriales bacterium]|jgi:hypothetical protein|nr:hypothetical protein [Mycobacteriales bacterium]
MTKFVVLYNSTVSAGEQMANASPEQAQAGMEAWMAWAASAGDAIVDLGSPLQARTCVTAEGVSDARNQASGYSVLQASSTDELATLLAKHPHLGMPGCSIDVLEVLPIPGM